MVEMNMLVMIGLTSHMCILAERASPLKAFIHHSFKLLDTMFERSLLHLASAFRLVCITLWCVNSVRCTPTSTRKENVPAKTICASTHSGQVSAV
jgi:hypothetical protein